MRDELEDYLRQCRAQGFTEKTVTTYRGSLEMLGRALDWPRTAAIRPPDLERYLASLRKAGWKRAGRRSICSSIRCFFGWLAGQGRILTNPARDLKIEREDEVELPEPPLAVEEVAALLDGYPRRHVADLRNRALLEVLYGCGLRLNEALALDLGDLDFTNRQLHVRQGKGSKARDLPLGRGAIHALRDYFALRRSLLKGPDHGAVFLDRFGRRAKDHHVWHLFKLLNKARRTKARHLHPHLLRHSIAVHLLQNGADVRYVQQFLGHAQLDTTKIYLRLVPGRLKEDYERAMPTIAVTAG